jgi:hypothetical protein
MKAGRTIYIGSTWVGRHPTQCGHFLRGGQEAFQMIINSEPESGPSRSVYARGVVREYGMRDDRFKSILNPVPDSAFRSSERC